MEESFSVPGLKYDAGAQEFRWGLERNFFFLIKGQTLCLGRMIVCVEMHGG